MSCDYNRPECNCGSRVNARCVDYEGNIPECSSLNAGDNISASLVFEDIYDIICAIKDATDVSEVSSNCVSNDGTIKTLLQNLTTKVCELEQAISNLPKFTDCTLNYGNLVDPCGVRPSITSQCELNQFILDLLNQYHGS